MTELRIVDCGLRNGAPAVHRRGHAFNPQSTIRNPQFSVLLLVTSLLSGCARDSRTPLVIYSPHGRDLLTLVEGKFEALRPDVDVRWLDMGTQEVYDRVRSERANPQADVWFGGTTAVFARAAAESLLAAYRPTWAATVATRGHGPADLYFATYETPVVLLYNAAAVAADQAPRDWDDLLERRWHDQVLIRDPLASGTMRAVWGMFVQRSLEQTGDTAAAWRWLRRLDAATREYVLNPALLDEKLARQEGLVSIWDLPDVLVSRGRGLPFGYTFPRSGTPVIQDPIAVVRGARHGEAAQAFVEYVGTPEAQLIATREAYRLPARADLPLDSLPEWLRAVRREMVVAEVDWALLAARGAEWMRWWDEHVRHRGAAAAR